MRNDAWAGEQFGKGSSATIEKGEGQIKPSTSRFARVKSLNLHEVPNERRHAVVRLTRERMW